LFSIFGLQRSKKKKDYANIFEKKEKKTRFFSKMNSFLPSQWHPLPSPHNKYERE